jgi:hypothetical protein
MSTNSYSLDQLQAKPTKPAAEARVTATDFMSFMRLKHPAPAVQPPPDGGGNTGAATAWHNAISGKGPEFLDVVDRQRAAEQWRKATDAAKPQAGVDRYNGQREVPYRSTASVAAPVAAPVADDARLHQLVVAELQRQQPPVIKAAPVAAVELTVETTAAVEPVAHLAPAVESAVEPVAETVVAKTKRSWGARR